MFLFSQLPETWHFNCKIRNLQSTQYLFKREIFLESEK